MSFVYDPSMDLQIIRWADARFDQPVPGLDRHCIDAQNALVAHVVLHPGATVPVHQHESEQISVILSGKIKWFLGEERREVIVEGGTVLVLPPNYPHGVETIETTHIVDVLSPHGLMGVDKMKE